jgi:virulence factor Mce-like protein
MGREAPRLSLILVAAAFALSCFGFTLFVWKSFGGPTPFKAHGYQVHVLFGSEASQLSPNADVRISGVAVGKVISVKRRGLGADALVDIDAAFAPIPADTRAIVRFKTLLGETFVALTPGSPDAPKLKENGTLPRANVADVQQVDRVLGSFDKPTREAFKKFLIDTSKALDGRGGDINNALGHLGPTTESVADLLEILDEQKSSLRRLIADGGVALRATGERGGELQTLITAGNDVFEATASRNREVTRTIQAFPPFLRTTRASLKVIDQASQDIAPTLRALRPVIPLLGPALTQTNRLAPELDRTFRALLPTIAASKRGLPALTRILNAAEPALKVLYVAGRELIPVANFLKLYRRDIVSAAAKTTAAVQGLLPGGDQHVLRVVIPINEESVVGIQTRGGNNRHNPYLAPGALAKLVTAAGLESYDCRNASNGQTVPVLGTPNKPCVKQAPFKFQKVTRQFPHVALDKP